MGNQVGAHDVQIGFQDGQYMVGRMLQNSRAWPRVKEALHEHGHLVNESKSEAWIPGIDNVPTENLHPEIQELFNHIPSTIDAIAEA